MAIKISQKIIDYGIESREEAPAVPPRPKADVIQMHEKIERPEMLLGSTYKIRTPLSDHALYVTINDVVLNAGTEHEQRRPFEIFINSKNMEHFQWIVALTRIVSAVFRKGGDVTFLVEELRSVFDPRGGYFKKGGRYMPSLVAEIGDAIEAHMRTIGLIEDEALDEAQRRFVQEKREQYERTESAGGRSWCAHPRRRAVLHQVPDAGGRPNGRVLDLPQLRRFQVRLNDTGTTGRLHAVQFGETGRVRRKPDESCPTNVAEEPRVSKRACGHGHGSMRRS